MNRSLKLSMLLLAALGSTQAIALKLGQIEVKSALGQPLLAEIPVMPESAGDLRNLRAQMASNEDFARAGITDGRTHVPLRFVVVQGPGNSRLIRITSAQAINDPFLDLLLEVDNASGKSVREFTILLDPPGMRSDSAALIAARSSGPAPSRSSGNARVERPAAATSRNEQTSAPTGRDGKYGPVKSGDTLSGIARQVSPSGVDINQMLLALKKDNPDAFYKDNVNALKSGAILRVPTAEQANAMSAAAALAEVRRQNGDWRAQAASAPTRLADAATGSNSSNNPGASNDGADHLALVPSKDDGNHAGGSGNGAKGSDAAGARQDLQRSEENLTALKQQSGELTSRVKDLQDINDKNERLLALKDNEIADLQRKLAEARKSAGKPLETPADAATAAAPDAAVSIASPEAASSVATNATATAPVSAAATASTGAANGASASGSALASRPATPAAAASAPAPKAVAQPKPVQAASAQPWYMQVWVWIAAAAAVLVLLLLALRARRAPAAHASASSLADRFDNRPLELDDTEEERGLEEDQDELLDQLSEHPDDISLHLELVGLYYHHRDVERFESAAEAMYAHVRDPEQSEWQDVLAMGEDLAPTHPLFGGTTETVTEDRSYAEIDEREALDTFDLETYAAGDDSERDVEQDSAAVPPSSHGEVSEYHFDFNLPPSDGEARPSPLADPDDHVDTFSSDENVNLSASDFDTGMDERVSDIEAESDSEFEWMPDRSTDEAPAEVLDPGDLEAGQFSDDPVDTKLDLARAYLDMGDGEGARAMLDEVVAEGTQAQRDIARELLEKLP